MTPLPSVTLEVQTALIEFLHADALLLALAPGDVWADPVPAGQVPPYVVVVLMTADDTYTLSGRAMTDYRYLVKAVGEAGPAVYQAAERIDALLTDGSLTLPTHTVTRVRRATVVEYPQVEDGLTIRHVGGTYLVGVV